MLDAGKRARQRRDRERVCVGGSVLQREKDSVSNKIDHRRKRCGANMGLISEMIKNVASDVVPTIHIFSLLIYKRHLDLMTSHKPLIVSTKFHYKKLSTNNNNWRCTKCKPLSLNLW